MLDTISPTVEHNRLDVPLVITPEPKYYARYDAITEPMNALPSSSSGNISYETQPMQTLILPETLQVL
jgi:hypothetical protein